MTTMRSSGRPQQSNIVYALGGDEVVRISVNDSGPKVEISAATQGLGVRGCRRLLVLRRPRRNCRVHRRRCRPGRRTAFLWRCIAQWLVDHHHRESGQVGPWTPTALRISSSAEVSCPALYPKPAWCGRMVGQLDGQVSDTASGTRHGIRANSSPGSAHYRAGADLTLFTQQLAQAVHAFTI